MSPIQRRNQPPKNGKKAESGRTSQADKPALEDLRLFAITAINNVMKISKEYDEECDESISNPFCTTLYNVSWSIKTELEWQKEHKNYDRTQNKKVESLLNNLERICSWPESTQGRFNDPWSTLKALKKTNWRKKAGERLRNLATNKSFVKTRADIIGKMEKFSSARLSNETAEMIQTTDIWTGRGPSYVSQKLEDDMQLLYATLQQYRSCKVGGLERDIMPYNKEDGRMYSLFDSKFPDFSHNPATTQKQKQYEYIAHENFCQNISSPSHDLLCLSIRDGKFVYNKRSAATRDWLAGCETVSLTSAFTKPELNLNGKSKAILQMLLAKATWEFYDSEIIGQGLTSDKIHFICEKRKGVTGAFVNEPVLLTRFAQNDSQVNEIGEDVSSARMIHKFPKILALGIMLLEIESGKSIKKHRGNSEICPSPPFDINTDYHIACNLIATGRDAPEESVISDINKLSPLRTILPLCIKQGELETKLQQTLSAQKKSISNIDLPIELRSFIYKEIVLPLEARANTYQELSRVKAMWEVGERQEISRHILPSTTLQTESRHGSSLGNSDYRYMDIGDSYKRVKIAILDTGIAQDDYDYLRDFSTDPSPSLEYEYKDFVNEAKDTPCDESGHGSAGVSLLLRMCPQACLYIARVVKTGVADENDVGRVVQAIDWAIDRRVDIITMALGFKTRQQSVVEAIDRAHRRGILIFSAASNGRNISSVYCPAILTDQVFGIYSTNAGIRESRSLNPSPIGGDNFAIFGEDVELREEGPLVRGTSYSTSMRLVWRQRYKDEMQELSYLQKKQGMKRIFQEMANFDYKYLCIRPWKLLKNDLEGHIEGDHDLTNHLFFLIVFAQGSTDRFLCLHPPTTKYPFVDLGKSNRPDSIALNFIGYICNSALLMGAMKSRIGDFGGVSMAQ
ncbi:hypothetical protein MKX08_001983 [Trichoderma sp. CBMAI-0020]|nr:hypothetical protein MKX08_001983 [Trichoderma sp. CBMAI-0020]